jgi:hypothetical protein
MENTCGRYLFLFLLSLSTSQPQPVEASRERIRLIKTSSAEISFENRSDSDRSDLDDGCKYFAIARNEFDVSMFSDICRDKEGDDHCWVGLRKRGNNVWKWLYHSKINTLPVLDWADNNKDNLGCGTIQGNNLHDYKCDESLKALCQNKKLRLVTEEKTWEEALKHCRAIRSNIDLLSFHDKDELSFTQQELAWTQTEEVWIGLRWLAGRWLWIDRNAGDNVSLPAECPANRTHCGTLSEKGLHARNCMEKRRFFCLYQA